MATPDNQPWTVLKLLSWTKDYLAKVNLEEPRLLAEMLLAHVLCCERIELYTRFSYEPTPAQLEQFRSMVQQARSLQPVAYLVGNKEFYSLKFKVTPEVLIPRPETEMLATEAIAHLRKLGRPGTVWDVGTGSGCIAIAIACNVKDATVLASDLSAGAVAVAQENAQAHKVSGRVRLRQADMLTLPEDCRDLQPFDVIAANPPYVSVGLTVSSLVKHEPAMALYADQDGLQFIRPLIAQAPTLLRPGGMLALEFGFGMADAVRDLIVAQGQFHEPKILMDHQTIERSAIAIRR
jgi:release factor glutamine methyltransferase